MEETKTENSPEPKVRDLFVWQSLSRPSQQYSKEVLATIATIALLLSVIFAFFQEWLAIAVAWAAVFLFYALGKVPPEQVEHKITSEGIVSMGRSYIWPEFGVYWFTKSGKETLLHVAHRNIFGQQVFVINEGDEEKIREILATYLPYIEVPEKSTVEKLSDWFAKKFPIEKVSQPPKAETPPPPPAMPPSSSENLAGAPGQN